MTYLIDQVEIALNADRFPVDLAGKRLPFITAVDRDFVNKLTKRVFGLETSCKIDFSKKKER